MTENSTERVADDGLGPEEAAAEERVRAFLNGLGVAHKIHRHPPLFTVEDSQHLRGAMPGAHVKNMFLKDKAGQLWLVTCLEDRQIRIRDLEKEIGARKMSFGKPDLLWDALGVRPGAVTPLAAIHDAAAQRVRVVLDGGLTTAELINAHPMHNRATLALSAVDLARVFDATGHAPLIVDFDALEAAAAARRSADDG